jgi:hypothetical protein
VVNFLMCDSPTASPSTYVYVGGPGVRCFASYRNMLTEGGRKATVVRKRINTGGER